MGQNNEADSSNTCLDIGCWEPTLSAIRDRRLPLLMELPDSYVLDT